MIGLRKNWVYLVLLIIYIVISILILFFFQNANIRNSLLYEYQAFRGIFGLMEALRENMIDNVFLEERGILGFSIYNIRGKPIFQWGDAPAMIDSKQSFPEANQMNKNPKNQSLEFIQPIGGLLSRAPYMERHMMNNDRMPAFVYLKVNGEDYFSQLNHNNVVQYILLFIFAVIMGVVTYLYRKLKASQVKLAQKEELARLGEISRTLSHEIKNPLGSMRIQTGILKKTVGPEYHGDILVIEEEIDRLSLLTRRIGDFVRDPLGRTEKIDLNQFLNSLIKTTGKPLEYKNQTQSTPNIIFDKERLRSVMENLIQNAIESHESNTPPTESPEVILQEEKGFYVISVLDRGIGLPQGHEEKIFDPFYSSKSFGSGIGLSIAKRFIEAQGGRILLAPREGGGTEARIYIRENK